MKIEAKQRLMAVGGNWATVIKSTPLIEMIEKFPSAFQIEHIKAEEYNEDEDTAGAEIIFLPKRTSSVEDFYFPHGTKVLNLADLTALTNWAKTTSQHIGTPHDFEFELAAIDNAFSIIILCSPDSQD